MKESDTHPLFDKNITWLTPDELSAIRHRKVDQEQIEREQNYERKRRQKPSHELKDDANQH